MRAKEPWYDWPWPKISKEVLRDAGYQCQIRGPKCKGTANQTDHVIPPTQGGAWFDKSNLRASCGPCNLSRVDHTGAEAWRRSATRITLVLGPPCSGKAAFVEQQRAPGDLVVDYEALAGALGGADAGNHQTILKARGAVLSDIKRGKVKAKRVWIISANPRGEEMFPFHDRVVIDPGREQCIERARQANRDVASLVDAWYGARAGESSATTIEPSRDWLGQSTG